jgi:hypothetical protein
MLTRAKTLKNRYAFKTAEPAADWLEATLGPEPVKKGLCPAAKAVKGQPLLLACDAATLQRNWGALTLPAEQGGVGIAFTTEHAREAMRKHPQLLGLKVETYARCWSMLTASQNGQGLSPEEARHCILRAPTILLYDNNAVLRRAELLQSLGYAAGLEMVLAQPHVLNFAKETVRKYAAWWQQTGLDHVKLITALPTLLGGVPVDDLQAKLGFFRQVAGTSDDDLNNAPHLFGRSLDRRLRPRFFYALQKHEIGGRFGINTLMHVTDATYVAMMQGGTTRDRASEAEVARFRKHVASAEFLAWSKEQEARILRRLK